jgi:hypothetical protein
MSFTSFVSRSEEREKLKTESLTTNFLHCHSFQNVVGLPSFLGNFSEALSIPGISWYIMLLLILLFDMKLDYKKFYSMRHCQWLGGGG